MRFCLALGLLLLPLAPALAQEAPTTRPFSPLSGPNTPVDSPICAVVNFGFCPQPAAPPPLLPDPQVQAAAAPRPLPPPPTRVHRRHHRADAQRDG